MDELRQIESSVDERNKTRKGNSYLLRHLTSSTNDNLLSRLDEIKKDIESWKYIGKIYCVIDCKKDQIKYHQLITSWVNTPDAFKDFNHLSEKHRYSFLIGDTGEDWTFDVNKYREHANNRHYYAEHESEIIFPMNKKYAVDIFYGTLEEFYEHIRTRRQ